MTADQMKADLARTTLVAVLGSGLVILAALWVAWAEVSSELALLRAEVHTELAGLRGDLRAGLGDVRAELDGLGASMEARFAEVDAKLDLLIARTTPGSPSLPARAEPR